MIRSCPRVVRFTSLADSIKCTSTLERLIVQVITLTPIIRKSIQSPAGMGFFFILIDHTCAIYWTNKNGALARPQASGARNIKDMSVIGDDRYVSIGNIGARSCDFDQVAGRRCNDRLALDNSISLFDCVK